MDKNRLEKKEDVTEYYRKESLKWAKRATECIKEMADLQESYERLLRRLYEPEQQEQTPNKILTDIKRIVEDCKECCVEPPAMKFKCPKCKESMINNIRVLLESPDEETLKEGTKSTKKPVAYVQVEEGIEQKFFKSFRIEPVELPYPDNFECYPELTDGVLLELMCILNKINTPLFGVPEELFSCTVEDLRTEVLGNLCMVIERAEPEFAERLKHQVQSLFKED